MSEDTRLRVLAAAEKLGYVPDPVATRLASRRNHMLGLYTFKATFPTDVADSYYPILVGVEEQAAALGQDLILFTGADGRGERTHDEAAIRRTKIADGCLFFGRHVPVASIEKLVETGFPLVYIGRRDELEGRIPFVGPPASTGSCRSATGTSGTCARTTTRPRPRTASAGWSRRRQERASSAGSCATRPPWTSGGAMASPRSWSRRPTPTPPTAPCAPPSTAPTSPSPCSAGHRRGAPT